MKIKEAQEKLQEKLQETSLAEPREGRSMISPGKQGEFMQNVPIAENVMRPQVRHHFDPKAIAVLA